MRCPCSRRLQPAMSLAQAEACDYGFIDLHPVPWRSVLAAAETVGFVVADKFATLGVPAESAPEPVAEVAELADLGGAGADLDVRDRPLPRTDAVDPILATVVAHV